MRRPDGQGRSSSSSSAIATRWRTSGFVMTLSASVRVPLVEREERERAQALGFSAGVKDGVVTAAPPKGLCQRARIEALSAARAPWIFSLGLAPKGREAGGQRRRARRHGEAAHLRSHLL